MVDGPACYSIGRSRHPWLCRWWLRATPIELDDQKPEWLLEAVELHVPWWAWPMELLHRAVFGYAKLAQINDCEEPVSG